MKVEVGKVYKCGNNFVLIVCECEALEKAGWINFIGIGGCSVNGELPRFQPSTSVVFVRFCSNGDCSEDNGSEYRYPLRELPSRETITIGETTWYKDEFEAATAPLKKVNKDG